MTPYKRKRPPRYHNMRLKQGGWVWIIPTVLAGLSLGQSVIQQKEARKLAEEQAKKARGNAEASAAQARENAVQTQRQQQIAQQREQMSQIAAQQAEESSRLANQEVQIDLGGAADIAPAASKRRKSFFSDADSGGSGVAL